MRNDTEENFAFAVESPILRIVADPVRAKRAITRRQDEVDRLWIQRPTFSQSDGRLLAEHDHSFNRPPSQAEGAQCQEEFRMHSVPFFLGAEETDGERIDPTVGAEVENQTALYLIERPTEIDSCCFSRV